MENLENFTGLYELNRTLRFRLIPFDQTKEQLKIDGVIQKDRTVQENYKKIKEKLDDLHRLFVQKALTDIYLEGLSEYEEKYKELQNDPKNKKLKADFEKIEKSLRKELVSFFVSFGNTWKEKYSFLKKGGIGCLTEKEVLDLLIEFTPEEKELFESFKGFFTYFSNFNESRKNFYADDGRAGAIATRAINENLQTFVKNIDKYKTFSENNPDFFSDKEKSIFEIDYYNELVLQEGIDNYNKILGGYSLDDGTKIKGINERINLLKQQNKHSNKKDIKYPKFDLLYKQILSKKDNADFIQSIEDNDELFEIIHTSIGVNKGKLIEAKSIFTDFFDNNQNYDISQIYLSKQGVNTLSSKYFESWETLKGYLGKAAKNDFVSFAEIKEALSHVKENSIFKDEYYTNNIAHSSKDTYTNFLAIFRYEFFTALVNVKSSEEAIKKLEEEKFIKSKEQIETIKNYFDSVLDIYKITRYFNVEKNRKKLDEYEKDITFYTDFDNYFNDFELWKSYNLIRNYLTKKEIKTDKFKLNFDNSQFLTGWDKDKEKERFGSILRKDGKYYLAVLKKLNNKVFVNYSYNGEEDYFEKMEYKQLNNVYRQLPRLTFPLQKKLDNLTGEELSKYISKYEDTFGYNDEIAEIKKEFDIFQNTKEKGDTFEIKKLKKLIKYYQNAVMIKYGKLYDLSSIETKEYDDLASFYDDIERKMYSLEFVKIASSFLENLEKNGDIYLFQIYNKDFSEYKKADSRENIHTKYFKYLFDSKNLENLKIKLSGGAEIFFRDKTENLKQAENKDGEKLYYDKNGEKKEVLENRRYAKDSYLFHISTTLNANEGDMYKFNQYFNENYKPKHIIGIDRGEKHLAYYSVIDLDGNLVETGSLNIVNEIDYLAKLEEKEKSRKQGRLNWGEIENIKNLKNGYISAVVNNLAKLIVEYDAVIVFEDLNSGFKRGRQKIERQVYQKLELALAKKLNYLTFKDKADDEIGGILNGLQLVPKVNDYQDIANYKQSGVMFYTNPAYTSTTCPNCGWRKTLKFPMKVTKQSIIKFFKDIEIYFGENEYLFKYKNGIGNPETLTSNVERTQWNNKKRETVHIDNITEKLTEVFKKYDIDKTQEISNQFFNKEVLGDDLKKVFYNFKLLHNIRNSDSKKDEDIISCASCGYNSNDGWQGHTYNGDANGAYNTARKGIIMLERMKENPEKPKLIVKNEDWDKFLGRG